MKAFVFPGQGSQTKGMGGSLFDEFSDLTDIADNILGYSIKELCLEDPREELNKTQFTQPALYVVNALSYFKEIETNGVKPDYVAGHSLGEFNALLAADVFSFELGLKLVKKRGELMSLATGGGMAAIINGSKEAIESALSQQGLTNIDLANFNSPKQIVISGLKEEIEKAEPVLSGADMMVFPLKTSGAFHSRFMQSAKDEFEVFLQSFMFAAPQIPVIANVTARPYESHEIVLNLANQITHSVRWTESIEYLLGLGEITFTEIGTGNVLTRLVRDIQKAARVAG